MLHIPQRDTVYTESERKRICFPLSCPPDNPVTEKYSVSVCSFISSYDAAEAAGSFIRLCLPVFFFIVAITYVDISHVFLSFYCVTKHILN